MPSKERQTRQRQAIRDAIADAGSPLSPREILEHAQSRVDGLGMATVYRTLKMLADAGVVILVEIPGEAPRYELAGKAHHHHFYCRACGKVFEVEGCCGHFDDHAPKGFEIESHEVMLIGRCAACAGAKPSTARKHRPHNCDHDH